MVVTGVKARNVKTDEVSEIEANGVFIYVGLDPLTEPFKKAGITNEAGWIETDQEMRTKIPGVYAIGDVREKHCVKSLQRSVKAVLLDNKYLTTLKN